MCREFLTKGLFTNDVTLRGVGGVHQKVILGDREGGRGPKRGDNGEIVKINSLTIVIFN